MSLEIPMSPGGPAHRRAAGRDRRQLRVVVSSLSLGPEASAPPGRLVWAECLAELLRDFAAAQVRIGTDAARARAAVWRRAAAVVAAGGPEAVRVLRMLAATSRLNDAAHAEAVAQLLGLDAGGEEAA